MIILMSFLTNDTFLLVFTRWVSLHFQLCSFVLIVEHLITC